MCLFVIDGTWSRDFNCEDKGLDNRNLPVGKLQQSARSNSRKFYEESTYSSDMKYYYGGPKYGITGADIKNIYNDVFQDIEQAIVMGKCKELSLVGWSRGAVIASELAQGLMAQKYARTYKKYKYVTRRGSRFKTELHNEVTMIPNIKFIGLFDPVEMVPSIFSRSSFDSEWGDIIPKEVDYFVQIIAGNRSGPIPGIIDFTKRNPLTLSKKSFSQVLLQATHADIGGQSTSLIAQQAYQILKLHSMKAGVL